MTQPVEHTMIFFTDGHNIKVLETLAVFTAGKCRLAIPGVEPAGGWDGQYCTQQDGTVTWVSMRNVTRIEVLA